MGRETRSGYIRRRLETQKASLGEVSRQPVSDCYQIGTRVKIVLTTPFSVRDLLSDDVPDKGRNGHKIDEVIRAVNGRAESFPRRLRFQDNRYGNINPDLGAGSIWSLEG